MCCTTQQYGYPEQLIRSSTHRVCVVQLSNTATLNSWSDHPHIVYVLYNSAIRLPWTADQIIHTSCMCCTTQQYGYPEQLIRSSTHRVCVVQLSNTATLNSWSDHPHIVYVLYNSAIRLPWTADQIIHTSCMCCTTQQYGYPEQLIRSSTHRVCVVQLSNTATLNSWSDHPHIGYVLYNSNKWKNGSQITLESSYSHVWFK